MKSGPLLNGGNRANRKGGRALARGPPRALVANEDGTEQPCADLSTESHHGSYVGLAAADPTITALRANC